MSINTPKTPGVVTIRYVVMSLLNRMQDYSMKRYKHLLQICLEGYMEELVPFHLGAGLEVCYLKMSAAKTCALPTDYTNWNKIGYPLNGKLRVITRNDSILLPRTFSNTLTQAAAQFVTDNAAAYLVGGVVVTSSGDDIILTAAVAGVDFAGATTITNVLGDLAGTVVHTTANAPGVKRVDTITLSGAYGSASILCDATTKVVSTDSGETVGNNTTTEEGLSNTIFFSDHFRNGQFVGGLFGLPGGIDSCYFRIDEEERQIVFSGETPRSEIVLEYFSSGLAADGSSLIARNCVAPLRAYLQWHIAENDPRIAYNEKQRKKNIFEEEISGLRSLENTFSKEDYLRMVWGSARQSPRR